MSRVTDGNERKAGELNQHGCSMTGFAFQLMDLVGPELAVVIFGERDCVSAFPRAVSRWVTNPWWDVYTVALDEADLVAGRAEQRLEECLEHVSCVLQGRGPITSDSMSGIESFEARRAVMESGGQPCILVLSTCLAEVVGADAAGVCARVSSRSGLKIMSVSTSGLRLRTQAEIVDQVIETMISAVGDFSKVDPRAVNLIGFETDRAPGVDSGMRTFRSEASELIAAFGGSLNAALPAGANVADWRNLPHGGINFVSDASVLSGVIDLLRGDGRVFCEVVQPKGVATSDLFYGEIAAKLGVDPGPILAAYGPRQDAVALVEQARRRFSGMRLAYGIGTLHNFRPDVLAREGLGNLPLFVELGFDVEIVIQERDYPEVHERIRRNLAALGVKAPYRLYYEPAVLEPALRDGRFDCAYVADFMRDQVSRVGIPMLNFGERNSGYGFTGHYIMQIARTLGSEFDRRFSRYFGEGGGR